MIADSLGRRTGICLPCEDCGARTRCTRSVDSSTGLWSFDIINRLPGLFWRNSSCIEFR